MVPKPFSSWSPSPASHDWLQRESKRLGRSLHFTDPGPVARVGRIPQDRDAGDARQQLLQQLEPLCVDLGRHRGRPRDVPSGAGDARDDPGGDGIADRSHDDREGSRSLFRGESGRCASRNNDVDLETDRLRDKRWVAIIATLCPSVLDHDVLALDVAEIAQFLAEGGNELGLERGRGGAEEHDPVDLPYRLRLGGEGRGEQGAGQCADERSPRGH
jgi:hypothetical protein